MGKTEYDRQKRLQKKRDAERRRREAIKADPELQAKQKAKEHLKYLEKKRKGQVKLVADMSRREHSLKKKQWKINSRKSRKNKKKEEKSSSSVQLATLTKTKDLNSQVEKSLTLSSTSRVEVGKKMRRRNQSKLYRENQHLKLLLKKEKARSERYKKRWQRSQNRMQQGKKLTPNSRVAKELKGICVPRTVRRKLVFAEALREQLADKYKQLKDDKSRQMFTKMISGKILKKYKFLNASKSFLKYKRYKSINLHGELILSYVRRPPSHTLTNIQREAILSFYADDGNSKLCSGKKDTKTMNKVKYQKRILTDTVKNLCKKFNVTHPTHAVSYATFAKLKPLWIVKPSVSQRDTCLCIKHANIEMLSNKLHQHKIINENSSTSLIQSICCSTVKEECLHRECINCNEKKILFNEFDANDSLNFMKWVSEKETIIIKGTKKTVQKTQKKEMCTTVGVAVNLLEEQIPIFLQHVGNDVHQKSSLKFLKTNMQPNEILFHIDFSENFSCKYSEEAQSVHFGASRQQVSLHTGVLYTKEEEQEVMNKCFCTLSDSLRHDPIAIWSHMIPIFHYVKEKYPHINIINFWSDGPSTQYRNKSMFYIFGRYLKDFFPEITKATWNYCEAGHGKGAPDGVGAVLKRSADQIVAQGTDIADYATLVKILQDSISSIYLKKVTTEDINNVEASIANSVRKEAKVFRGTMRVHQLSWSADSKEVVHFRALSCFQCLPANKKCKHYMGCISYHDTSVLDNIQTQNIIHTSVQNKDTDNEAEFQVGEWVAFTYQKQIYPGKVKEVYNGSPKTLKVSAMESVGSNLYRWPPVTPDIGIYFYTDILKKIPEPVPSAHTRTRNSTFFSQEFCFII